MLKTIYKAILWFFSNVHLNCTFWVERTKAQGTILIFDFINKRVHDFLVSGLLHTVKGMCNFKQNQSMCQLKFYYIFVLGEEVCQRI